MNPQHKVLNATAFGPHCMQDVGVSPNPNARVSEDCLSLNVYRPSSATHSTLAPVLFWIHGGGFTSGGGNETRLIGAFGVELMHPEPYVVVTFNYR